MHSFTLVVAVCVVRHVAGRLRTALDRSARGSVAVAVSVRIERDQEPLVGLAVTVVVDAVAELGARHATAAALVDLAVAVVVDAVAELGARHATAAALVDLAVAVVVDAVARLRGNGPAGTARIRHALVDLTIAVVVRAIADFHARHARAATFVEFSVAVVVHAVAGLGGHAAA
jgi:hypothetical protein